MARSEVHRQVLLAGASGLVGRALLTQLLDEADTQVHALLRRDVPELPASTRLTCHRIDFAHPTALPTASELFVALGTTIRSAGSQAGFRVVDLDAVIHIARAARAAGIDRVAVVSALGADLRSPVFYNRVKGEMEAQLATIGFARLVIARPSLLAGKRSALGQPRRLGEQLALAVLAPIGRLLPARVRPIEADVVARAMRIALRCDGPAIELIESAQLQTLGQPR